MLEIEIKFEIDKEFREKLKQLGAKRVEKVFERNIVFDTKDRSLFKRKMLLRLREEKNEQGECRVILTFKKPYNESSKFKEMEELEVYVSDFDLMRDMLHELGFKKIWIYEKIRECWRYGNLKISLDTLPKIGKFMEIEGSRDEILNFIENVGLRLEEGIKDNYFVICERKLGKLEDLVFK